MGWDPDHILPPMIHRLKLILGMLLLACIFLPLGSCQDKQIAGDPSRIQVKEQAVSENVQHLTPLMQIKLSEPDSWILFLSFIWPLPLVFFRQRLRPGGTGWKAGLLAELFLALLSTIVIYSFIFKLWYEPTIFGYLAILLMTGYAALSAWELKSLVAKPRKS